MIAIILMLIQTYCQMFGYNGFIADWDYALLAFMIELIIEVFIGFLVEVIKSKGRI